MELMRSINAVEGPAVALVLAFSHPATELPCPVFAPSSWRKGGKAGISSFCPYFGIAKTAGSTGLFSSTFFSAIVSENCPPRSTSIA